MKEAIIRRKRFSVEKIIEMQREAEVALAQGIKVGVICRTTHGETVLLNLNWILSKNAWCKTDRRIRLRRYIRNKMTIDR
jgi:hypothetical protein